MTYSKVPLVNLKSLFFGASLEAPWPRDYPSGKMIPEEMRHLTLAFLGQIPFSNLQASLASLPRPSFKMGPTGVAKELIFLPPENCRVAALALEWLDSHAKLNTYQKELVNWLTRQGYAIDKRPFLPHITIARTPFDKEQWQKHFTPLPFFVKAVCLYQSLGNLKYESLWESSLLPPFDELEHTADIAFLIRGESIQDLHQHAQLALAFKFPPLIKFYTSQLQTSLDEIILSLNEMVASADTEVGCPFKAISFHGAITQDEKNSLKWEMIVDV